MTEAKRVSTWRDRWIWVLLAVSAVVFVVIAASGWWQGHQRSERIQDRYACAIDPSSSDC